ncbi:unnamed protein product [Staurois parvus]|uniref:Uncharacterized protein n=1 Tax=Staurois parvus TaxID=386267 RepID=A0ABN9GS42_9NEOB|nr:unnamed protein product [Staurois parvus]
MCPIIGISGRNSAPSLVSVGGIVKSIIGVSGRIVPHHGISGRNSAPSLVSVVGIVPHHWTLQEE